MVWKVERFPTKTRRKTTVLILTNPIQHSSGVLAGEIRQKRKKKYPNWKENKYFFLQIIYLIHKKP